MTAALPHDALKVVKDWLDHCDRCRAINARMEDAHLAARRSLDSALEIIRDVNALREKTPPTFDATALEGAVREIVRCLQGPDTSAGIGAMRQGESRPAAVAAIVNGRSDLPERQYG